MYDKCTARIILDGKLKNFHWDLGKEKDQTIIQYCAGSFSQIHQEEKDVKGIQMEKQEVKLSLFADCMIRYTGKSRLH